VVLRSDRVTHRRPTYDVPAIGWTRVARPFHEARLRQMSVTRLVNVATIEPRVPQVCHKAA